MSLAYRQLGKPASVISPDHALRVNARRWLVSACDGWINMSSRKRAPWKRSNANMNLARPFTPTANRRLNELIGFLVFVFAVLLVLALVSYSPLDPSLNTAATPLAGTPGAQLDRRGRRAWSPTWRCNSSASRRF